MVRGFEVSHLLGEMNIRNTDIHPNWNDIRSTAYMNKLGEIAERNRKVYNSRSFGYIKKKER